MARLEAETVGTDEALSDGDLRSDPFVTAMPFPKPKPGGGSPMEPPIPQ